MSTPRRKAVRAADAERLRRLEQLARLHAEAARARAGRAIREETHLARAVEALDATRRAALAQLNAEAGPDPATVSAMGAFLRKSESERARLNVQLAALRARSQTAQRDAARAVARQTVVERLARTGRRQLS